jgi:nicotinamide-nucleotide amidase
MKPLKTEIISVGTELLLGQIANTDAQDISLMLSEIGIDVYYHTVVGDNPERLRDCILTAKNRVDVIITTGGLGPTYDDLTKQIVADCFGLPLIENKIEKQFLYDYITNVHSEISDNNYQQSLIPEGSTIFHNKWGTAPGCAFRKDGKIVIMIPGPPREARNMFKEYALPFLASLSDNIIVSHEIRIFGTSESRLDNILRPRMSQMTNPTMAPYAKEADCLLRITAKANSKEKAEEMIKPVMRETMNEIGDTVYGVDIPNLESRVYQLLSEKRMTFSCAESCTGGDIAKRFTDIPGASQFFVGGVVTYTDEMKEKLLGIPPDLLKEKSAVSREVAFQMAKRIKEITSSDIGVSVTGLAGPTDDGIHEIGTVFTAIASKDGCEVVGLKLGKDRNREYIRRASGNFVFDMIRRYLTGLPIVDVFSR